MPHMDIMAAARKIREKAPAVILLFITSMAQYAIHGYEVDAQDFIVGDANMLSGDPKQRHPGETSKPTADATPHEIRHGVLTGYAAAHDI